MMQEADAKATGMEISSGQTVQDKFYSKVEGSDDQWKSKCGKVRVQKGTG